MQYYVIHVLTGSEDDFSRRLTPVLGKGRIIVPKKRMPIKRRGITRNEIQVLFPGYVFMQSEAILEERQAYWSIRRTEGFIRFLLESKAPSPLPENDLVLLRSFISFGNCADISKVTFDENDRIVVLEGPLKGLEGRILKVDRRKRRARVRLDMYESSFPIDLGFEVVERVKSGGGVGHEESGA
jgi:transcription termination/antitermination protein NusG